MHNEHVYKLDGGKVAKCLLASWPVPVALADRVIVSPGEVDDHTLSALPAAAAIIRRVAPWARCYAVPSLVARCYLEEDFAFRTGVHRLLGEEDVIILGLSDEEDLLTSAFHESWHAVESYLAPHCANVLNAAAARGFSYSDPYRANPRERLARGFAAFCMSRLECPPDRSWRPTTSIERMWSEVESGAMAKLVMEARSKLAARKRKADLKKMAA